MILTHGSEVSSESAALKRKANIFLLVANHGSTLTFGETWSAGPKAKNPFREIRLLSVCEQPSLKAVPA
jgi:hypothetical protein